jgi:enoyl-CoA hydratase/carnithine racemase
MIPTGGITQILPRKIGLPRAQQLILFGEVVDAGAAHAMGLAWKVVPADRLLEEAQACAARISALPQHAVRQLKRALARSAYLPLEDVMAIEVDAVTKSFIDPATAARVADFRKQKPK